MSPGPGRSARPAGFFLLRSAALPWEPAEALLEPLRQRPEAHESVRQALAADALARARQPEVREALAVASESIHQALEDRSTSARPGGDSLERPAFGYLIRMSSRSTPFGLFGSVSLGQMAAATRLDLGDRSTSRRHIDLDAGVCLRLARQWESRPEVRRSLRFWPTPQRALLGGMVRYVPTVSGAGGASLLEVKQAPHLLDLLAYSEPGRTLDELSERLRGSLPRVSEARRQRYLEGLIEAGLLDSELVLSTTGPRWLDQLLAVSGAIGSLAAEHAALREVQRQIGTLEATPPGQPPERLAAVRATIEQAPLGVAAEPALAIDLWRPAQATLGGPVVDEMLAVARLTAGLPQLESSLEALAGRLRERYEGRLVPLLEALDEDHGVGFPKSTFQDELPLLQHVQWPAPPAAAATSGLEARLLPRLLEAVGSGAHEIVLGSDELGPVAERLPTSFAVSASLAARSADEVDQGQFLLLEPLLLTPSAGRTLGRFSQGDAGLRDWMQRLATAEQQADPDAVWADVVDVAYDDHSANVVRRPVMRAHEIVLQGRSGAPPSHQIPLQDLLVGVDHGVFLVSARLGRRVRVRTLNAINAHHPLTLPLRQFFGALERQDKRALRVSWGTLDSAPFLPRLRHQRSVLRAARWRLTEEARQAALRTAGRAQFEQVQRLREQLRWPRWLRTERRGQTLVIDLDHPLAVEDLLLAWRSQPRAEVEEFLPALFPRPVRAPDGDFVHEVVVPFTTPAATANEAPARARPMSAASAPVLPGHDLLYLKLHGAPASLEAVLLERLAPLLSTATPGPDRMGWFFVRYRDAQGDHLRVRVGGAPLGGELATALLARCHEARERGQIDRLQLDTYEPETHRYGGPRGLALCEGMFWADSVACLSLLDGVDPDTRWRRAALGLSAWLDDLELRDRARQSFLEQLAERLEREWSSSTEMTRSLGVQFRAMRQGLAEALRPGDGAVVQALAARSAATRPRLAELVGLDEQGELTQPLEVIHRSLVHMFCNRVFERAHRAQEFTLYALLARHVRSELARS